LSDGSDCKFLKRLSNGKGFCKIYTKLYNAQGRFAVPVIENLPDGKKSYCVERKKSLWDYLGCPLNSGKPLCPFQR